MTNDRKCPQCGTALPCDAIDGLCPKCMVNVVFGEGQSRAAEPSDDPAASGKAETDNVLERPGMQIGRYRLLEQIGEGGFGVVYMAEQVEPVHRKVALKIVKAGMDTKEVIARFEAERQALALMDHPNICRILDAGVTGAADAQPSTLNPQLSLGRPYFVMELVKGIPITEFCDLKKLSPPERLDLFVKVCQAVQHAHQKGIIHRDLKPSNVLVTLHDGAPVPKVIDFGIAKALGPKLTEKTLVTGFAQMLGTPAYMSPEQAELSGLDIDTRSDIYSLGVLLYELLTGVAPFDKEHFAKAALDEVRRMIRETDPPRPSTRLRSLSEGLSEVAQRRSVEPATLSRLVRGDLDWIVMKCLEKDRKRRYETANGLARDIERHLKCEPVVARPPSRIYEFQKTVRRHKFGFAAAAAIFTVLIAGFVVSTWNVVRAKQAERSAEQVAQFLKDMLKAAGPSVALGRDATLLKEVMENAAKRLKTDLHDQPEVRGDLWFTLGTTFQDMGDHERAVTMLKEAVADFRLPSQEENTKLATALGKLGYSQSYSGNVVAGSNNAYLGHLIARKCGDPDRLATCLYLAARSLRPGGMIAADGEPWLREAVGIRRKLDKDPVALAGCLSAWGLAKDPNDEAAIREALKLYEEQLGPDHKQVGGQLFVLGQVLRDQKRFADAESVLQRATENVTAVWDKKDPYQPLIRLFYARTLLDNGKPKEAEAVLFEGMELGLFVAHFDPYLETWFDALERQGRGIEMQSVFKLAHDQIPNAGYDLRSLEFSAGHGNFTEIEQRISESPTNHDLWLCLGNGKAYRGEWSGAVDAFSRVVELAPWNVEAWYKLGVVLLQSDRETEYRMCCRRFLDLAESRSGDFFAVDRASKLFLMLPVQGEDFERAAELADRACSLPKDHSFQQWAHLDMGLVEYRRGNFKNANEWLHRVISMDSSDEECKVAALYIQAAVFVALGDAKSGRASLASGDALADQRRPGAREVTWGWLNMAIAGQLRKEAATRLEVLSPTKETKATAEK